MNLIENTKTESIINLYIEKILAKLFWLMEHLI